MPQKHDKNNYFGIKQFENVISTNSKKFKSKYVVRQLCRFLVSTVRR